MGSCNLLTNCNLLMTLEMKNICREKVKEINLEVTEAP